jgi:hypothetical protein
VGNIPSLSEAVEMIAVRVSRAHGGSTSARV